MLSISNLNKVCAWTAAVLMVTAGAMLSYEVLARHFFTRPTIWAAELSQLCLIWGCLLAMPWVLEARRHIAVDALVNHMTGHLRRLCETVAMLFVALLSVFVCGYGWIIFYDSFRRGRTTGSMLDLPTWVSELAVPVGFALLFVQALRSALTAWRADYNMTASTE